MVCLLGLMGCGSVGPQQATPPSPSSSQAGATPNGSRSAATANPSSQAVTSSSVLDGVFTTRQASSGETRFRQVCAACHSISDFRGGRFRLVWVGRTVGDLFQSISTLMPEDDPGSLSPEEYSAILSYMLRENGYPAGEEDLAADASTLQNIHIVAAGG